MLVKLAYQLDNLSSQLQENIYSYNIIGIEEKREKDRPPIFYTDRKKRICISNNASTYSR